VQAFPKATNLRLFRQHRSKLVDTSIGSGILLRNTSPRIQRLALRITERSRRQVVTLLRRGVPDIPSGYATPTVARKGWR